MNIDEIDIKFMKYDPEENLAIVNVIILGSLEIRGFLVRYATLKSPPHISMWIVSPPSVKKKKTTKTFWIVRFLKVDLWREITKKIISVVIEETNIK